MRIPKVGSILIPEIENKIEQKLKDLNLKPEISIKKFLRLYKKHRYFTSCFKGNKKIVFYSRLHNNLDAKEKFIREIEFLRKLKKKKLKIKKIVPKILNYGIEKDFEWYSREYLQGLSLKESQNLIKKPFLVKKIVKTIFDISKISPKIFPKLKKFNFQNYLAIGIHKGLVKKRIISKTLSEKILNLTKENLPLLEKENKYFCHGDLNLGNILSDGKRIWIVDWELIHLNNFAYDIAYLFVNSWKEKRSFRRKLIQTYINQLSNSKFKKFKKILPTIISYFSSGGILQKESREKKSSFEKRRRFYINLLKNCLNFNKLIKT